MPGSGSPACPPRGAPGMPLGSETPTSPVRSALCFSRRRSPLLLPFTPSIPASPVVPQTLLRSPPGPTLPLSSSPLPRGHASWSPHQSSPRKPPFSCSLFPPGPQGRTAPRPQAFKTCAMRALGDYVMGDAEQTSCGFALASALRGPGKAGVIGNCSSQRGDIRQVQGAREVGDHSRWGSRS